MVLTRDFELGVYDSGDGLVRCDGRRSQCRHKDPQNVATRVLGVVVRLEMLGRRRYVGTSKAEVRDEVSFLGTKEVKSGPVE